LSERRTSVEGLVALPYLGRDLMEPPYRGEKTRSKDLKTLLC
jgi:hypothetical protein